jgi:hypothetical protein
MYRHVYDSTSPKVESKIQTEVFFAFIVQKLINFVVLSPVKFEVNHFSLLLSAAGNSSGSSKLFHFFIPISFSFQTAKLNPSRTTFKQDISI